MKLFLTALLLIGFLHVFASEKNSNDDEDKKNVPENTENKLLLPWYLERLYTATPPLKTQLVDGKVVITEILNQGLITQGLRVGMEITEINGMNVIMYADKHVRPYISYSSNDEMVKQVYGTNLLIGYINDQVMLTIDDGIQFEVKRDYSDAVVSKSGNTKIIIEKVQ